MSSSRLARIVMFMILAGAGAYVLSLGRNTVSNFLLAIVLSYCLAPLVQKLEGKGMRTVVVLAAIYTVFTLFGVLFFKFLTPFITSKIAHLAQALPKYVSAADNVLFGIKNFLVYRGVPAEKLANLTLPVPDAGEVVKKVYDQIGEIGFGLFHLMITPIVTWMMLVYRREILESFSHLLPERNRDAFFELMGEINAGVFAFMKGQGVIVGVVFVLTYPALLLIGVKYPFFNSVLVAVLTLIPFIGTFVAICFPIFFAVADGQGVSVVWQICLAYAVIHCIEGYVIKPLIYKSSMHINPLLTTFLVLFMGEVIGLWGVVMAIPLAGAVKITYDFLHDGRFLDEASVVEEGGFIDTITN